MTSSFPINGIVSPNGATNTVASSKIVIHSDSNSKSIVLIVLQIML